MGTKRFSNYESLLTFTRASKGHALRPVSYGAELVTNGDFATDSDWTKEASWTISGGTATYDGAVHVETLFQNISLTTGKIIKISYTVKNVEAGKTAYFNVVGSPNASPLYKQYTNHTEGDYEIIATVEAGAVGLGFFALNSGTGGAFDLDNVSVKEVLFDQPDGTLTLFEHPDNVPRVEYDADGNRLGLLVEEARTNLIVYSDFTSGWAESSVEPVAFNQVGPDRINNSAITLQDNGAGGSSSNVYIQDNAITISASTNYTASVFVKAGNNSEIIIKTANDDSTRGGTFNISTETFTPINSETGTIQNFGNGWYRCAVTWTSGSDTSIALRLSFPNITRDGTNTIYLWGAQLEAGSFPTSYMKTTGSTAIRSADVASIPVADFGFNKSAFTLLLNASWQHGSLSNRPVDLTNSDNSERVLIYNRGGTVGSYAVWDENIVQAVSNGISSTTDFIKVGVGIAENNFALINNGVVTSTDTLGTVPTPTDLKMQYFNGHIKSIQYYPRRLTNAQLQDLTS